MGKNGLLRRTLSVALAAGLAVTLVPVGAISFAEEVAASSGGTEQAAGSAAAESSALPAEGAMPDGAVPGDGGSAADAADNIEEGDAGAPLSDGALPDSPSEDGPIDELAAPDDLLVDETVRSVSIPATVERVSPLYFWQFPNAVSIVVDEGNTAFAAHKGILYTADFKTLVAAPLGIGPEVVLATGCEQIAAGALRGVSGIERIQASSVVQSIFTSATDTSEEATGYIGPDVDEGELSAFAPQTVRDAMVQLDVDPDDAIEAAFAWRTAGFHNVQVPEAPPEADPEADEDAVADAEADGADEPDDAEGTADHEAAADTAVDDAGSIGGFAPDDGAAPAVPVEVLDTEKPLEHAPQPAPRPQVITGEYDILGTSIDNAPEPDRVITSEDVLSYEVPIVGQADDATAPSATSDDGAAAEPAEIESAGAEQAEPENADEGEELEGGEDSAPDRDAPRAAEDALSEHDAAGASEVSDEPQMYSSIRASSGGNEIYVSIPQGSHGGHTVSCYTHDGKDLANGLQPSGSTDWKTSGVSWSYSYSIAPYTLSGVSNNATRGPTGAFVLSGGTYGQLRGPIDILTPNKWSATTLDGRVDVYPHESTKGKYRIVITPVPDTGYYFEGWQVQRVGEWVGADVNGYQAVAGQTHTAKFLPITYTITYDSNGGSYAPGEVTARTYNIESTTYGTKPAVPTRPGYRFAGYEYSGELINAMLALNPAWSGSEVFEYWDAHGGPAASRFLGNATAKAKWEPIDYTLTFDADGGEFSDGTTANKSVIYNIETTSIELEYTDSAGEAASLRPTKEGYEFVGWMVSGDLVTQHKLGWDDGGTRVEYVENAPVLWSAIDNKWHTIYGNGTFKALWMSRVMLKADDPPSGNYHIVDRVYYYPGYGYLSEWLSGWDIHEAQVQAGGTRFANAANFASVKLTEPRQAGGYTFKGYHTEEGSGGSPRLTSEGKLAAWDVVDGETTWYTQWEAIAYTITLDAGGGAFDDDRTSQQIEYKRGVEGELVGSQQGTEELGYTPQRSNWDFVGWRATSVPSTVTSTRPTRGIPYANMYLSTNDYGDISFRAVWRAKITLDGNAPTWPKPSKVTQSTSSLYYYDGYGFSFTRYASGSSGFGDADNFYAAGSVMLAEGDAFTKPTCDDAGWLYDGYGTADGKTTRYVRSDGLLSSTTIAGNATWYAWWAPRSYTATLDAGPGTQEEPRTISFHYGDTKLPGVEEGQAYSSPSFSGWTFDGYYLNGVCYYVTGGSGTTWSGCLEGIDNPEHPLLGDCTLTARWVRDIPIDANGGASAAVPTIRATYGEQLPATAQAQLPSSPTTSPKGVTWTLAGLYSDKVDAGATQYYDGTGDRKHDVIIRSTTPSKVYARWQRTVAVDANGGTGSASVSVTKGQVAELHVEGTLERTGYSLRGYYEKSDAEAPGSKYFDETGAATTISRDVTVPATIYAQWSPDESIIAFDLHGGKDGPANIVGATDRAIADRTLPAKQPVKPNYLFAGWWTEAEDGEELTKLPEKYPAGGITYHAHWTLKPLSSITFKAEFGGAVEVDGQEAATYTQSDIMPDTGMAVAVSAVPDMGYRFAGWFDEEGEQVSATQTGWVAGRPSGGWPANTTYTARFEQGGYTITYRCAACGELDRAETPACSHVNSLAALPGGFQLGDVEDGPVTVGAPEMLPYYAFAGYSGTDLAGDANTTITLDSAHLGDKAYTIHARPVDYTLVLDAAGGSWAALGAESGYAVAGERATRAFNVQTGAFQLPVPQRAGFTFDHWERDGARAGATFIPGPANYGDAVLVAAWVPQSERAYQITYLLSDTQGPDAGWIADEDAVYNYGEDDEVSLPIPQRVGYDFAGWTEESELPADQLVIRGNTPQMAVFIDAGHTGDRIFRAHWKPHEYDVAYDLAGGAWDDPQPALRQTFVYDKDVTIARAPGRASYAFKHWEVEGATGAAARLHPNEVLVRANLIAKVGAAADDDGTATNVGTVTLTAVWTPRISFDVGVAGEGVHMGLKLAAGDGANPFSTNEQENWGTATLTNRTDARIKVISAMPSASVDYGRLTDNALRVFRDRASMGQASFTVRPVEGALLLMTIPKFGIASSAGGALLPDSHGLPYSYGWMMEPAGAEGADLKLYYQLNMGALTPEDVRLSDTASLEVAGVRFAVALVDEQEDADDAA